MTICVTVSMGPLSGSVDAAGESVRGYRAARVSAALDEERRLLAIPDPEKARELAEWLAATFPD